ncbi:hypothetical protein [Ralstonia sp. OTU4908]|jgi:hypothetical protein|uniref:hypothetical protein n=1 Tax=Ralstonia sp. OTU4908 TaxID=3043851 RepID=UPI00313B382E
MILEIGGKKLVFGMDWPTLVEQGAYGAVAARKAFSLKSPLLWHQGEAGYAGFLRTKEMTLPATSGPLYAAAQAFGRIPGLPANALLVFRTPDRNFAAIGLMKGRPATRFDLTGLTGDLLNRVYLDFGRQCGGEGFTLVGDADAPLPSKPDALSLEDVAKHADATCLLKPPTRAAFYKRIALSIVTIGMVGAAIYVAKQAYFPPNPNEQKTPTELYQENIQAHADDAVVLAPDYTEWYQWMRTTLRTTYGGWELKKAACDFHAPNTQAQAYVPWSGTPQCQLTFFRANKDFATNETFFAAAPKEYQSQSVYLAQPDQMVVSVKPPVMQKTTLGKLLAKAGLSDDRDVRFVSQMQAAGRLVKADTLPEAVPFLVPAGVPVTGIKGPVYRATHWSYNGSSQYVKLLGSFPTYSTLSKAELTVEETTDNAETPFHVALDGELITRN